VAASGRKWPQVAAPSKWPQVAASGHSQRVAASGRKWPLSAISISTLKATSLETIETRGCTQQVGHFSRQ